MDGQLRELLPFLHDKSPQVRQIALANLLGHTLKDSPHRDIFFTGLQDGGLNGHTENETIRVLKLLCRDRLEIAHDAFRALVNLSDSPRLTTALSEPSFLVFLVSYIIHPPSILADLGSMLLSNLTMQPPVCTSLLSLNIPVIPHTPAESFYPPESRSATSPPPTPFPTSAPQDVPALPLLIHAFVHGAQTHQPRTRKGELHFLASVFANISVIPSGRIWFVTPRPVDVLRSGPDGDLEYPLSQITAFTEHGDTIRRGGVASTIKNCAFHVPAHPALLAPDTESTSVPPSTLSAPGINLLPDILLPLAGPEEFDLEDQERLHPALQFLPDTKQRERDAVLRLTHVETLLLLCVTRRARDSLRTQGVYEIVRALHLVETSDKMSEHVERLVNVLQRDEGPDEGDEGILGVATGGESKLLSAAEVDGSDAARTALAVESDDEENGIEEV